MKKGLAAAVIAAALLLNGCGMVQEILASEEMVIRTTEELQQEVERALKEGRQEITFATETITQEDLSALNQEHDGFYGSVTQYEMKTVRMLGRSYVTLSCDISDNYYVEEAILSGSDIPEERTEAAELKEVCEEILSDMDAEDSSYKKEKKIHDYLVEHVAYGYPEGVDSEDSTAYNAYGALVKGKAVCNGYAQAMKLLCDLSGVECEMISGRADGENHAWNLIRLDDDAWYHVDVTWDDPEPDDPERLLYSYFNLNDEEMALSHVWNAEDFVPAEGTRYQYYRKNDLYCEDMDDFREKCEDIFAKDSPESFQVQVGDYEESRYSEEHLQFLFEYSGARYCHLQTIGEAPYTTLYFTLDY